tara:strand:- start:4976 stop:6202 length:1227 start_codon:yes stop_codon:yes gene_type:complete
VKITEERLRNIISEVLQSVIEESVGYATEHGGKWEYMKDGNDIYVTKDPQRPERTRENPHKVRKGSSAYNAIINFDFTIEPEEEIDDPAEERRRKKEERRDKRKERRSTAKKEKRKKDGIIKAPCIIFTGEFSPASDPILDSVFDKIESSKMDSSKKSTMKTIIKTIVRKIPEGHGGTIVILPPTDGGTVGKATACEFGRYKGKAPAALENEMSDAIWDELNASDDMDTTSKLRKEMGLAVPGRTKISNLGSCDLIRKKNGNYTISPEEAERLVEKVLRKGGYPGTTRNPLIVDGCVYSRAMKFAGEDSEWRPYLLIPGMLPKIITNMIGLDAYAYDNCGTYGLKVALTGVYGSWSKVLSNVMVLLAAPETMIRIARVLFPQTLAKGKTVDKKDVLTYRRDSQSKVRR